MRKIFVTLAMWLGMVSAQGTVQAQALPEHGMLKMDDGNWHVALTLHRQDGTAPTTHAGTESNSLIGGLWSVGKMEIPFGDDLYVGFATLGYDPVKAKYVGTWVDSTSPHITEMEGTYDPETKTLILFYTTYTAAGVAEERKNVMVYQDHNTRDFDSYLMVNGQWQLSMEILYTRTK
ncbi:MAG: DUF1579 family protein [Alphaproteobacteria bacterium]|nr:DUF1579 family protein [Alphaproteobacteria bacterium]